MENVDLSLVRMSAIRIGGMSRNGVRKLVMRANRARLARGASPLVTRDSERGWWKVNVALLKSEHPTLDLTAFVTRDELSDLRGAIDTRVASLEATSVVVLARLDVLGVAMARMERTQMHPNETSTRRVDDGNSEARP